MIVGGGYIAVEFAGIFNGLGVDTTLVYRGAKILRGFDEDLRDDLTAAMRKRGVTIITGDTPTEIEELARASDSQKLRVHLSSGGHQDTGAIMYRDRPRAQYQGPRP